MAVLTLRKNFIRAILNDKILIFLSEITIVFCRKLLVINVYLYSYIYSCINIYIAVFYIYILMFDFIFCTIIFLILTRGIYMQTRQAANFIHSY